MRVSDSTARDVIRKVYRKENDQLLELRNEHFSDDVSKTWNTGQLELMPPSISDSSRFRLILRKKISDSSKFQILRIQKK